MKRFSLIVLGLLSFAGSAQAQIIPSHGTLEFSDSAREVPKITVKASNGSPAYVLTLTLERDIHGSLNHIEVVMHRPESEASAANLLEPHYRWHGLQEYMFNAIEFADGLEHAAFGKTRTLKIKHRKLDVTFTVTGAEVAPVKDHPSEPGDYVFKKLMLDVDVANLK